MASGVLVITGTDANSGGINYLGASGEMPLIHFPAAVVTVRDEITD